MTTPNWRQGSTSPDDPPQPLPVELLRLLLGRLPAGVFMCDATGRNTFVNEGLSRLTGLPIAELLGLGWAGAVHPEDLALVQRGADRVRAGAEPQAAVDFRLRRPDGSIRHVHVVSRPISPAPDAGWVGVMIDLTEQRRFQPPAAPPGERPAGLDPDSR